ncbi:MAG: NADP-dependent phosphogluconate dehydrogenase [Deltaproteobacteria bacterium]|nr:NADP-dependent phosphogluconate dehydrogenase [Deltaproteobacteria bacterium]
MDAYDVGLVGLAVMGQNLALNMEGRGFAVAVYNRSPDKTHAFIQRAAGRQIGAFLGLPELAAALGRPRRIFLMVKAGEPVDALLDELAPLLDQGDAIADCGNSFFLDTERRSQRLAACGIGYLGVGVSGGEEGALRGPSIMPGGPREAYELAAPVLRAIAARAGGEPCEAYLGQGGAGHLVKMVHNGIEYGDMQLIAEVYDLLHRGAGIGTVELAGVFAEWNRGELASYLTEITACVLARVDEGSGEPLVEKILDSAGQKGTGRWTARTAIELGVAVPTIQAALDARALSTRKAERVELASELAGPSPPVPLSRRESGDFDAAAQALYAARLLTYAQGFALLQAAREAHGYEYELGEVARIWRAGCIIRARFLEDVQAAFAGAASPIAPLRLPLFRDALAARHDALRHLVGMAIKQGVPAPALAASLAYYDTLRSARLPASLIQAQRDCFGAHGFERVDRQGTFHASWGSDPDT